LKEASAMSSKQQATRPWYREPWPWILMAGPVATIFAGAATAWLAVASDDGLVADDYYKQGLAINQELRRERAAATRGIVARIEAGQGELRIRLEGRGPLPEALFVKLAHATRAGFDMRLRVESRGAGLYECALPPLAAGHWRVVVEDPRGEWRLAGEWPGSGRQFALSAATG
jgi:hypothetical protein